MEKEKKIVKDASYFFYFLAALDVVFIIIFAVALNKANPSVMGVEVTKTIVASTVAACVIDIVFDIFLGTKGLAVVKGTNKGTAHITVALIVLILEAISIPVVIYSITKAQSTWLTLAASAVSLINVCEYYVNCKKLKA